MSNTTTNGAIAAGMQYPKRCGQRMWEHPAGSVEVARPVGDASLLAQNNTRVWVEPDQPGSQRSRRRDAAAEAMGNSRMFYNQYRSVGGHNGTLLTSSQR